jgi:hypothetical protein
MYTRKIGEGVMTVTVVLKNKWLCADEPATHLHTATQKRPAACGGKDLGSYLEEGEFEGIFVVWGRGWIVL